MNIQLAAKKETIFESTLELIKEHGFHGTPMSLIAKRADVAIGTIYHYFASKDELIYELFIYCRNKINDFVFYDGLEGLEYKERFFIIWKRFILFHLNHQGVFSFIEQFHSSPFYELIRKQNAHAIIDKSLLIDFLREGGEGKHITNGDLEITCAVCLGSIIYLIRSNIYGKVVFNEKQVEQLIETIWKGVKLNNNEVI